MISFMIQQVLFQNSSPNISEIGHFFYNFALPVKPGFTRGVRTGGKSTWPSKTQKIAMMHKMSFYVWWKEATYSI